MHRTFFTLLMAIFMAHPVFSQEMEDFFEPKTTLGGYGDIHYNYNQTESGKSSKTLDFHRFVLYLSHAWTENWSFLSELEMEHNYVENGQGSIQLEQAYLNYHFNPMLGIQAGVLLTAMGLINENHEPTLFLSVERPEYAKSIIPTTWYGNGIGFYGFYNGFDYRLNIMEGLNGAKISNSSGIRSARQQGFKSNAEELLYNARIDYLSIPGLKFGTSVAYNNAVVTDSTNTPVTMYEVHAQYNAHNIYTTFEYGNISYAEGELEQSMGYYFDLGYNIASLFSDEIKLVPWLRWSDLNTSASTISAGTSEEVNHYTSWKVGLFFQPHQKVVLKADYGFKTKESDKSETTLFNLGAGYLF